MSDEKLSPGPWAWKTKETAETGAVMGMLYDSSGDTPIERDSDGLWLWPADARAIAAVPEMVALLEMISAHQRGPAPWEEMAAALLKRIKGES